MKKLFAILLISAQVFAGFGPATGGGGGGGGITALTGDVTASGTGSVAATLAATTNATLTTLSALTSVGTIGTGTWQGTIIGNGYGGTGANSNLATGIPHVATGTWTFSPIVGADLPTPAIATLGGVFSKASVSHNFLTSISSSDGSIGQAQPAFTDISGTIAASQLPNITNSSVQVLSGYTAGSGTVSSSDTPLTAIQKLDGNIAALPAAPTVSTVNTTDATVTTIYTMATASDTSYTVTQTLIGRRTGGSGGSTDDSFGDYAVWLVKNVGGTASVVQISQQGYADQGNENWTLTAAASTTNVLFKVKGVANNNISWKLSSSSVSQ